MNNDFDQQLIPKEDPQVNNDSTAREGASRNMMEGTKERPNAKVPLKIRVKFLLEGFAIGAVVSLIICGIVFNIGRSYNPNINTSEPSIDLVVLQEKIEQRNELVTATYLYTNAENFVGEPAIFGLFDIPYVTGKDFILKYDGAIKAGVNLDNVEISQKENGAILVSLPQPYIISHELDEESFETIREHETIFSSIKINDIQQFRAGAKEKMEVRAYEKGVMDEALANAQENIRSMIEMVVPEGTVIEFQQAE